MAPVIGLHGHSVLTTSLVRAPVYHNHAPSHGLLIGIAGNQTVTPAPMTQPMLRFILVHVQFRFSTRYEWGSSRPAKCGPGVSAGPSKTAIVRVKAAHVTASLCALRFPCQKWTFRALGSYRESRPIKGIAPWVIDHSSGPLSTVRNAKKPIVSDLPSLITELKHGSLLRKTERAIASTICCVSNSVHTINGIPISNANQFKTHTTSFTFGSRPFAISQSSGIPSPSVSFGAVPPAIGPPELHGDTVSSEMSAPDLPSDLTWLMSCVSTLSRDLDAPTPAITLA
ncbi:hypothetical protein AG1IA_04735 [Rhizoctonia solani AG-1 IA]|uniref:Uncharacterized protein n=1 Tax=Thanatephorus cucumeris (strain AG1-IA) TaxID=983506 RepID=L8WWR7_THACA|nr:hypothetical protein AG1IA_04735 [Rhizoctonia solani AG-1 IA]